MWMWVWLQLHNEILVPHLHFCVCSPRSRQCYYRPSHFSTSIFRKIALPQRIFLRVRTYTDVFRFQLRQHKTRLTRNWASQQKHPNQSDHIKNVFAMLIYGISSIILAPPTAHCSLHARGYFIVEFYDFSTFFLSTVTVTVVRQILVLNTILLPSYIMKNDQM